MPTTVCHKCLNIMDNFTEFRIQIQSNNEKLRKLLKLSILENGNDEFETEIVKLDPNKIYESSDDEQGAENLSSLNVEEGKKRESMEVGQRYPSLKIGNSQTQDVMKRKEIFHCKYCDIVFSESNLCTKHETYAHDQLFPFECLICKQNFNTQPMLIIHIKSQHHTEKPYLCVQCPKTFIRRSDLRKHVFVHAGIRLFNCNLCTKSFTRSTNLTKHKRSHETVSKSYCCMLCPKAFHSNDLLSRHMEIHMNRNSFNCKFCNLVFTQRNELEIHQRNHIAPSQPQSSSASNLSTSELPSIIPIQPLGFYNQIPLEQQQSSSVYEKQNTSFFYNQKSANSDEVKNEYPIMNQLLSKFNPYKCDRCTESYSTIQQLQTHQSMYHSKNFTCTLCNLSYYKKKELDRHILSIHSDIKFNCSKCSKSFSRKDKLLRHEKVHLIPQFYNCAHCAAVFIRKPLLDLHMKIHEIPNNIPSFTDNNLMQNFIPRREMPILKPIEMISDHHAQNCFPINLSFNNQQLVNNEPINLSNEQIDLVSMKIDPPKIVIDSDDEENNLKIIENNSEHNLMKLNKSFNMQYVPRTEKMSLMMNDSLIAGFLPRMRLMEKLEPSKDLPMEILQSPN